MMLAVQQDEPGGPLVCRQVPVPRPNAKQVLVRMAAAPINPSDLGTLKGRSFGDRHDFPLIPGREGSGRVVLAGGSLMSRFLLGKRVACGVTVGDGTWAEYAVAPASLCIPLKRNADMAQSAMLLVNPLTAMAIFEIARQGGHKAIVSTAAASALGGMILRLGQREHIPVIHIVRRESQVELVRQRGGENVLNSSDPDFNERLTALAAELNATLLLDAIAGSMTKTLTEAAPYASQILLYSRLSSQDCQFDAGTAVSKQLRIQGWLLPNWFSTKSLLQGLRLANRTQMLLNDELHSPVRRQAPLDSIAESLDDYQANMSAGKILLVADPDQLPLA
jgi:NADPH:quinone reductase-like Zn-dependent oxidoreductase